MFFSQVPGFDWPPDASWVSSHFNVGRYLRAFASWLGANSNDNNPSFSYNTRVESVTKRYNHTGEHQGWKLLLRKFVKLDADAYEESWWTEVRPDVCTPDYSKLTSLQDFDAVIVASGRFNVPHIPAIPGLAVWQERFPDRVLHSRQYRRPEHLDGRSVLVVGAGVSHNLRAES